MPLQIIRNDILNMDVEAIVNPTDYCLSGSASIDKRIHEFGGIKLKDELNKYGHCDFGDSIITNAYNLKCKFIIHTVGPFWNNNEEDLKILESCYINSLYLAKKHKIRSLAFPLIATGSFGCPKDKALNIAINAINTFLFENNMKVYLVVYTNDAYNISSKLVENIKSYINNDYIDNDLYISIGKTLNERKAYYEYHNIPLSNNANNYIKKQSKSKTFKNVTLDEIKKNKSMFSCLKNLEQGFGDKIIKYIDEFGFTDVEVYKAAEISRQLFQKVKNNENPSKKTALALCVVLPLTLEQVKEVLASAGYAFNTSNKFEQALMLIIKLMEKRTNLLSILKINLLLDELGVQGF